MNYSFKAICIPLVVVLCTSLAYASPPSSFAKSKKHLNLEVYHDQKVSFYCGCSYKTIEVTNKSGKKRRKEAVDHESCGYEPRKNARRATFIEWEHIVPAWKFGHQLKCWQDGGRKNCRKDPVFKVMEADMFNLVPAIGEANGDRSNYRFGMIEGESRRYGACDFEVDFKQKVAEPTKSVRGDIARAYFYMRDQYGIKLSKQQIKLLTVWGKVDPVSLWECERDRRIEFIQGNSNSFVKANCSNQ